MKRITQIYSIFGQIESVVADTMVAEGLCKKIEVDDIPPSAKYDDQGRKAHCALVLSPEMELVFNRRVKELYA